MKTYEEFKKQADYLTPLTHDDFDAYPYTGKADTHAREFEWMKQIIQKTKDRAADRTDYDGMAKKDNPSRVDDIVVIGDKPLRLQDWEEKVRTAIAKKDMAAGPLLEPNALYVRTDKPGIAADMYNPLEPKTLESYVNVAYGGKPREDLVALLKEYGIRYGAYADAKSKLDKIRKYASHAFQKTATIAKTADYIATIPISEWDKEWNLGPKYKLDYNSFKSKKAWDKAFYANAFLEDQERTAKFLDSLNKLVAGIAAGTHMEGPAGKGEKGPGEVYVSMQNYPDDEVFIPYAEWKARADKLNSQIMDVKVTDKDREKIYDISPKIRRIANLYIKTNGKRMGRTDEWYHTGERMRDAASQVYNGNVPSGVLGSVKDMSDADDKEWAAWKAVDDAKRKLRELFGDV